MSKLRVIMLVLGLGLCSVGFIGKPALPVEGIYDAKLRTFGYYDFFSGEMTDVTANLAELFESQPEEVSTDINLEELERLNFGRVKLGNNNQSTWFILAQHEGIWPIIYVDQNNDGKISVNEKIKGIKTELQRHRDLDALRADTGIPVAIDVSIKGEAGIINKKLYFFIMVFNYQQDEQEETYAHFVSASFFDGTMKVWHKRKLKEVKYRIVDGNSNGCFNDYQQDLLFLDKDGSGYFTKKEGVPLMEYFEGRDIDGEKHPLRLVVTPLPGKVAVVGAEEMVDRLEQEVGAD